MDSTVVSFDQIRQLIAFGECGIKRGLLKVPQHTQPMIDQPELLERFVRWADAGMPEFPLEILPFDEPQSHLKAREILGEKFLGVLAAQRSHGAFTAAELKERAALRLRNHKTGDFLTEEETLRLCRACSETHLLCAMHPRTLPAIHARHPERFNDDPDAPWFCKESQRKKWSGEAILDPWVLVPVSVVPGSCELQIAAQKDHLGKKFPNDRFGLPAEFASVALTYLNETGKKLCEGFVVRFSVQTADSFWVDVEWNGDRLYFSYWHGDAGVSVGSWSVRTS